MKTCVPDRRGGIYCAVGYHPESAILKKEAVKVTITFDTEVGKSETLSIAAKGDTIPLTEDRKERL